MLDKKINTKKDLNESTKANHNIVYTLIIINNSQCTLQQIGQHIDGNLVEDNII